MEAPPENLARREIHDDLMYLAGRLPHRSAQTIYERQAAEFIQSRMRNLTDQVEIEDFQAIANHRVLFASYYLEFLVAGLFSIWWPLAGAAYGAYAFVCYLAEFMGFRLWSRLLPEYESQNVVGRQLGSAPRVTLVVTAHYDSGSASSLEDPQVLTGLRRVHFLLLFAMVAVIATALVEGFAAPGTLVVEHGPVIRWTAIFFLLCAGAGIMLLVDDGEDVRGANNNASGICAMLQVAAELKRTPIPHADVLFVATGSQEAWMSGMRHFLHAHKPEKADAFFVNIESVGAGKLHFLEKEGLLHANRLRSPLRECVLEVSGALEVPTATVTGIPTAAHILHTRGFHAVTLMGLGEHGLPDPWCSQEDRFSVVDEDRIADAATACTTLLRHLADLRAAEPRNASIFS